MDELVLSCGDQETCILYESIDPSAGAQSRGRRQALRELPHVASQLPSPGLAAPLVAEPPDASPILQDLRRIAHELARGDAHSLSPPLSQTTAFTNPS